MNTEIKKLVDDLNRYRDAYYNKNNSLIPDEEYDRLYDKLAALEKKTGIIYANSPTQTVGYKVVSGLNKVKHSHPLLSLDKTTEIPDFVKFFGEKQTVMMAKMDGLTCSITYEHGNLVKAESRGDGETGEDVTHNAITFSNLPKHIPNVDKLVVDGEAIIDYETFERIKETENTEYKNPRNLASGSVRQLDSKVAARRNIKFVAWKLHEATDLTGENILTNSFSQNLIILDALGFEVVPMLLVNDLVQNAELCIKTIKAVCADNQYPIDGIVGMFDDIKYGQSLGMTGHHPKNAIAFKFYQERNKTVLRDIEWQTSRTGLINPVAVLDPVEIDGTTVTRATLSNVSVIRELQLGIGDSVTLIKANQIIPKIVDNLDRTDTYKIPDMCPDCCYPAEIRRENDREMLYCTNENCIGKLIDKMSNFVARNGMNIIGLSREKLAVLIRLGYIREFSDIYTLVNRKKDIVKLDGFGKASVDNMIQAISKSRKCNLSNFLTAIGITGIGKSGAKEIAKYLAKVKSHNSGIDTFLRMVHSDSDWSVIDGFGSITSHGINSYVKEHEQEIVDVIQYLEFADDETKENNNVLGGKTFCITGKMVKFANRDAFVAEIEKNGGIVTGSVTAKTDFLITNDKDSGSSKNKQAAKYGTKVISEEEFVALVNNAK